MKNSLILLTGVFLILLSAAAAELAFASSSEQDSGNQLYLPVLMTAPARPVPSSTVPRVNVPYFHGEVLYPETAVFWFGKISSSENSADVRIGSNADGLFVNAAIFDRYLWYDPQPQSATAGDAVSLYLRSGSGPGSAVYRFDAMLNWWEPRQKFQAAYRWQGNGWTAADLTFTSRSGWRGNAPNNNQADDRGWSATFQIPFSALGLNQAPAQGEIWKMALVVHDKDSQQAAAQPQTHWPKGFQSTDPLTWGDLHFGIPSFSAPALPEAGRVLVRHRQDGAAVPGAAVGGGTTCGAGLAIWSNWATTASPGSEQNSVFNVQNQVDVADWPCFSRYYLTFPLDAVPPGKAVLAAKMTLHQMGSSGGNNWGTPYPSYIQVLTVKEDWGEKSLTWNNAPQAQENVSGAWVQPMISFPGWPGVPWEWDLSAAVQRAYENGEPLRLVIYSADEQYHSGKYFVSSYTGDWNYRARPSLSISWGNR